jgi:hypothetical protein
MTRNPILTSGPVFGVHLTLNRPSGHLIGLGAFYALLWCLVAIAALVRIGQSPSGKRIPSGVNPVLVGLLLLLTALRQSSAR